MTRDVSGGGLGTVIPAPLREAQFIAAQIAEHTAGALEVLLDEGRLTTRVPVRRAEPSATGVGVGLEFGAAEDQAHLRRLAALNLWPGAPNDDE